MKSSIRKLVFAALIGAVYAALTMALAPISYGPIQFRISEVLCILPFFFPPAVWGLFVGCILANLLSTFGLIDVVFGSLATLIAALATMYLGKLGRNRTVNQLLAPLPPVLTNGVIIGAVLAWSLSPDAFWQGFALYGIQVAFGELVVLYVLGLPLLLVLSKSGRFDKLLAHYGLQSE